MRLFSSVCLSVCVSVCLSQEMSVLYYWVLCLRIRIIDQELVCAFCWWRLCLRVEWDGERKDKREVDNNCGFDGEGKKKSERGKKTKEGSFLSFLWGKKKKKKQVLYRYVFFTCYHRSGKWKYTYADSTDTSYSVRLLRVAVRKRGSEAWTYAQPLANIKWLETVLQQFDNEQLKTKYESPRQTNHSNTTYKLFMLVNAEDVQAVDISQIISTEYIVWTPMASLSHEEFTVLEISSSAWVEVALALILLVHPPWTVSFTWQWRESWRLKQSLEWEKKNKYQEKKQ